MDDLQSRRAAPELMPSNRSAAGDAEPAPPPVNLRLQTGLVADVLHPEVLVTRSASALSLAGSQGALTGAHPFASSSPGQEHPAIADLATSLEALHEMAQRVLADVSALTLAPRELQTVLASSTDRLTAQAGRLEQHLEHVTTAMADQIRASTSAAQRVRTGLFDDAVHDRLEFSRQAADLFQRLAAIEARSLAQSQSAVARVLECTVEAAELVQYAAEQAATDIAVHVKKIASERRRGERALAGVLERVDVTVAHLDEARRAVKKRRFRRR